VTCFLLTLLATDESDLFSAYVTALLHYGAVKPSKVLLATDESDVFPYLTALLLTALQVSAK
jgi:hypothetical protein